MKTPLPKLSPDPALLALDPKLAAVDLTLRRCLWKLNAMLRK